MTISERLMPEVEHELVMTRKMLEQIPEDKLGWRPHEKSMTMGRLAGHVAEMPNWAFHTLNADVLDIGSANGGAYQAHTMTSRQDTLDKFDVWRDQALAELKGTSDEQFAETWSLASNGHKLLAMPRGVVLRTLVLNHMIHHRGQLSVYLRLNAVAVPGMYGPSADESGFQQAAS